MLPIMGTSSFHGNGASRHWNVKLRHLFHGTLAEWANLAFFDRFWRKLWNLLCRSVTYDAVGSGYFPAGTDPTASDRPLFGQGPVRRRRMAVFPNGD